MLNLACHRVPTCALAEILCWRQHLLPKQHLIYAARVPQAASIGWPLILRLPDNGTALQASAWLCPPQGIDTSSGVCLGHLRSGERPSYYCWSSLEVFMAYCPSWFSCCLQAVQGFTQAASSEVMAYGPCAHGIDVFPARNPVCQKHQRTSAEARRRSEPSCHQRTSSMCCACRPSHCQKRAVARCGCASCDACRATTDCPSTASHRLRLQVCDMM